jgi:murein DD-endopeptidase MepM/ murein hydrolase activator NlpD
MDTGQLLGRVGNTGESGAPHLHFHISDGPAPLAANGLPFVITRLSWSGTVTNLDDFLTGTAPAIVRARPAATCPRREEMPLQVTVLDFEGPPARSGDRARYQRASQPRARGRRGQPGRLIARATITPQPHPRTARPREQAFRPRGRH